MSVDYSKYYRPITSLETATDSPLSVATVRRMADSIVSAKVASFGKLIDGLYFENDATEGDGSDTNEEVILVFAKRWINSGANTIYWALWHKRITGSDNIVWKLYCHTNLYTGSKTPLDTTVLGEFSYDATGITTSSGTLALSTSSFELNDLLSGRYCYFTLTAASSVASSTAVCPGLHVTAKIDVS